MPSYALVDGSTRQVVARDSETRADSLDHSPIRRSTGVPWGCRKFPGISGVEYVLQQLERTRTVKRAALLLKNQRDEMS